MYDRIIGQAHHHYERAFEAFLRARRVAHVSVNEARRTLMPAGEASGPTVGDARGLKSFDYVIYGHRRHLLVEIKGRKVSLRRSSPRLENWVTRDDVRSLSTWGATLGQPFEPAFVFVYWCEAQPPDALFEETFEHQGRWYAMRAVRLADYVSRMRTRSERWGTVHLPAQEFRALSRPFAPRDPHPEHSPLTRAMAPAGAPGEVWRDRRAGASIG